MTPEPDEGPLYFESPREAVPALAQLLEDHDWATLACYYDLEGSNVDPERLRSGRYFYDSSQEVGHPTSRGWLEPFPPSHGYEDHEIEGEEARVDVGIEIDEGGGMYNRSYDSFRMRRHPAGWQVLPAEDDGDA